MVNCRKETVKLLSKTFSEDSYSNILLDSVLSSGEMTLQERKFITTLYYGVLERKITLDHIISCFSTRRPERLDPTVLNILRTGIYQIRYMDSVPDNAAVNESVKLTRGFRISSASGFVNAVLRNYLRDPSAVKEPGDELEALSVRYSVSPDIISAVISGYGREFTESFLERLTGKPPVYIRLNSTVADEKMLREAMSKTDPVKSDILPDCYSVGAGVLTHTPAFRKGYFHVQDISSQLACAALAPEPGDKVLDLCSAPGGKSFTMAEMMHGGGKVIAFDLYSHRVRLIEDGAERLHLGNISAFTHDALEYDPSLEGADKVLCDVPCSGFGVMGKKPEIRYKLTCDLEELYDIQYRILCNGAAYLRKGGELVYSTCTLNRNENDGIIDRFLREHEDYEGVSFLEDAGEPFGGYKAVLGASGPDSDGFFISKIRRK
ncbi:16S rRNA (cytosine(967)-C(5))-methyltransferase RsmB [Ruminococcus sp. HUN007]|uniref:16S rRNA (cytosine(967)-C(5))-methyltransferase RsmB n=1 Tax=Ruminococcus sp. HUN007 TaxID=1514668 RepID=UPI0005D14669|nr:16S rRNA (cytosine(967)-C(5))-methyltransferase RsmB [Ruminococcus sp. HUN007]